MKMQLTASNYYENESNLNYMSVSQFKSFIECEAKTMAELKGEYKRPTNQAMLVGSYTHAAFESDDVFNQFLAEHNGAIFKKNGSKYADFEQADKMIETVKNDRLSMFALDGRKEEIFTGELFGVNWKIKVDSINHEQHRFADLKTTQDLHKRYYSEKYDGWVSFIENWGYMLQMAIYRKIIEQNTGKLYTPYIVAVTKENPPNLAVVHFDESRFDFEYEYAEMELERIKQVKAGELEPRSCGKCDYCRSVKELKDTIEVGDLLYA